MFVLVAFAVISLLVAITTSAMRRTKIRRLGTREELSDRELTLLFLPSVATADDIAEFLAEVARATEIPKAVRWVEITKRRGWQVGTERIRYRELLTATNGKWWASRKAVASDGRRRFTRCIGVFNSPISVVHLE